MRTAGKSLPVVTPVINLADEGKRATKAPARKPIQEGKLKYSSDCDDEPVDHYDGLMSDEEAEYEEEKAL